MDSNLLHAAGSDLSRFATFSAASEDKPQRGPGLGVPSVSGQWRQETGIRSSPPSGLLQPGRFSTLVRIVRVWGIGGHPPSAVGPDGRGDRATPGSQAGSTDLPGSGGTMEDFSGTSSCGGSHHGYLRNEEGIIPYTDQTF